MRLSLALSVAVSFVAQVSVAAKPGVESAAQAKAAWSEETRQALACEDATLWSGGEAVAEPKQSGQSALRWAKHVSNSSLTCLKAPTDLSAFNGMSFWLHSSVANNATFMIILESLREKGTMSYYSTQVTVDWTGWKKVDLRFRSFGKAREPAGWDKISSFRFTASGWNQRPEDESVWVIDELDFFYDSTPYRPAIRVKKYLKEPALADFAAKLRPGHPRLILLDEELPRLRAFVRDDPRGQAWYATIQANAQQLADRPVRIHELPDGRRLLSISRDVLNRMYHWGLLYRLEGDRKWLDRAYLEMAAVSAFPDWNPNHYLDTAEMMHAMAIGYDWFYRDLSEEQRKVVREGLWQHGLRLSYAAYMGLEGEGSQGWKGVENNWNFVCNGGSSLAAMALLDELPEPCGEILHAAFQYIQIPLSHFEPDGAWWEGMGYWGYSMRYVLSYLRGMETAFGTDFGFIDALRGKGFSMAGDFPVYLTSPTNGFFNFADSGSGGSGYEHWGLFYLAARFRNPLYLGFQEARARGSVEDLLYYEPFESKLAMQDVALDKYFRVTEVVTMRSSWTDPNGLFVGVKGGRNGIAHAHQDLGSFAFYGLGEKWIMDLGTEGQTYQSHKHHLSHSVFYRIREEGHNTLVLDPGPGLSQSTRGDAKITRFETSPEDVFAIADLTDAYRGKVVSASRGYRLFAQRRALLIQDEVKPKQETDLWWFAHGNTGTSMVLDDTGRAATLERNGKLCRAYLLAPADATLTVMDARPLPTSPDPDIQQQNKGIKKLAVHLPKTGDVTIAVLFVPYLADESEPVADRTIAPLGDWKLPTAAMPRLDLLQVDGAPLPGFSRDVFTYTVELPAETTAAPKVGAGAATGAVAITPANDVPGTAAVRVKAPAGGETLYQIRFRHPVPPGGTDKPQAESKPVTVRGITVSASHDDGNGPGNVLDGDLETRWSASGENEWIAFDFGQPRPVETVRVAWFSGNQRQTKFEVETSADGTTWEVACKGQSSGKTTDLEAYPLDTPQTTRYLRLSCHGNTSNLWNSIAELDFLPQPAK